MFKPWQTLLFFSVIFIFFLSLSLLPLPSQLSIGSIHIRIPKIPIKQTKHAENRTAEIIIHNLTKTENNIKENNKDSARLTIRDTIVPVSISIEFAENLQLFFDALQNQPYIHVLHYGDSQIEGDRITNYLRQQFQKIIPSCGEGLIIPFKVNQISQAIDITTEGNWQRYTVNNSKNKKLNHNNFGPLLQFVRYAPLYNDSSGNDSVIFEASLIARKNKELGAMCQEFKKVKLIYGNLNKPVLVQLYADNDFIEMKSLNPTITIQTTTFDIHKKAEKITLEFTGKDSPDLYAISFEDDHGIYFDNISLRGNSGTDFSKIPCNQLSSSGILLNVKLIMYQFGINVAPSNLNDYTFYENWVYYQLQHLKRCFPQASILVVGISDMSMNTDSGLVSIPSITKIRNAQKQAAKRANCAFWDTYEAMGGAHSMASWVKAGLASKDYTHFSFAGAQKISKLLFHALYNELVRYKQSKSYVNS
ncbi:MAG: hypothetical protein N2449_05125 [Bacteroidales bacterium]|nr:hypothetical protein [Bacteroidales bacterium]